MNVTEQDLRKSLETLALEASPRRFAVGDVRVMIRRRRRRIITSASACLGAIILLGVILPITLTGGGSPGGAGSRPGVPPATVEALVFRISVNGQKYSPEQALGQGFAVRPGERLDIEVSATVPSRASIADIWLGISHGPIGVSRTGPIGLRPILAHTEGIGPGRHTFRLTWTIPSRLGSGTAIWLAGAWTGTLPESGKSGRHDRLTQAAIYRYLAKIAVSR